MANVAEKVYSLIEETVKNQGATLWDVKFLKEGANWYLRVFIDKPEGIAIDPVIDEADPIDKAYFLEVCSCGIERELTKPWHFEAVKGQKVKVRLYKAIDGKKEFSGILTEVGEKIVISTENGDLNFQKADISKAYLDDFEN